MKVKLVTASSGRMVSVNAENLLLIHTGLTAYSDSTNRAFSLLSKRQGILKKL